MYMKAYEQTVCGVSPLYLWAHHPAAVWLVGPMFAALTGVAFKEGMCYGKPECAALFFVIPLTLLGGVLSPSRALGVIPSGTRYSGSGRKSAQIDPSLSAT